MVTRHCWLPELRLCLVRYGSGMTGQRFIDADDSLFRTYQGSNLRFLYDLRGADMGRMTMSEIHTYAGWLRGLDLRPTHPRLRQVILVDEQVGTALSMLLQVLMQGACSFGVCATLGGACTYLGVGLEDLDGHLDMIPA